jgi:hypothetical protein
MHLGHCNDNQSTGAQNNMSHQGHHTLSAKDVVFVEGFDRSASLFKQDSTLRIKDLLAKIEAICVQSGELSSEEFAILFGHGLGCEVLRPGAEDWQSGNLQLALQFRSGDPTTTPIAPPVVMTASAVSAIAVPEITAPEITAPEITAPEITAPSSDPDRNGFADHTPEAAIGLDAFGDDLDDAVDATPEFGADLMAMMGDAAPAASDFSGLDDLDGFDHGFELDQPPATASSIDDLSSPWDLSDDLDSMLMAH